jgi:uncharacterized membrane protein
VVNFRFVALVLFACALLFSISILRDLRTRSSWFGEFNFVVRIIAALVLLALLTGELRDLYGRMLADLGVRVEEDAAQRMRLENLKQLSLSGGWLLYSIALMAWGLVRRLRSLRVMAIVLFGVTTLKIVLFDLAFLDTSYRFISFIALGIMLLAASYLYRRYREIITEPSAE